MQWRILSAQGLRIVLAVVIVTIMPLPSAFAEHGRDFSAIYDFKDVSPVGANEVSVTLSLRLQNHSGTDIADAEVSLQDIVQESRALGVFPVHLSLMNHAVAKLSGAFIVPTRYVTQWRTGQGPRIVVRVVSDTGHAIRRPVELLYMPGVGR